MNKKLKILTISGLSLGLCAGTLTGVLLGLNSNQDSTGDGSIALSSFAKVSPQNVNNDVISKLFIDAQVKNDIRYLRFAVAVDVTRVSKVTMQRSTDGADDFSKVYTSVYEGLDGEDGVGYYYNSETGDLTTNKSLSDTNYYFTSYSIEISDYNQLKDFTFVASTTGINEVEYYTADTTTSFGETFASIIDEKYEALNIGSLIGLTDVQRAQKVLKADDLINQFSVLIDDARELVEHKEELEKIASFGSIVYDGDVEAFYKPVGNDVTLTMSVEETDDYGAVYHMDYVNNKYDEEVEHHFLNTYLYLKDLPSGIYIGKNAKKLVFFENENLGGPWSSGNVARLRNNEKDKKDLPEGSLDPVLAETNIENGVWTPVEYELPEEGLLTDRVHYQFHETWGEAKKSGRVLFSRLVALNPSSEDKDAEELVKAIDLLPEIYDIHDDVDVVSNFEAWNSCVSAYEALSEYGKSLVTNADKLFDLSEIFELYEVANDTYVKNDSESGMTLNTLEKSLDVSHGLTYDLTLRTGVDNHVMGVKFNQEVEYDNDFDRLFVYIYNPGTDYSLGFGNGFWGDAQLGNTICKAGEWTKVELNGEFVEILNFIKYTAWSTPGAAEGWKITPVYRTSYKPIEDVTPIINAIEAATYIELSSIEGFMHAFATTNGILAKYNALNEDAKALVYNYEDLEEIIENIGGRVDYNNQITRMSYYGIDTENPPMETLLDYGDVFTSVKGEPGNNYIGGFVYDKFDTSEYSMFGFFAYNPTDSVIRTYASDWGGHGNFWDAQLVPEAWTFVEINPNHMDPTKTAADGYLMSQADGIMFTKVMCFKTPDVSEITDAIDNASMIDLGNTEGMMHAFGATQGILDRYDALNPIDKAAVYNFEDLEDIVEELDGRVEYITSITQMSYNEDRGNGIDINYGKTFTNVKGHEGDNYLGNFAYSKFDTASFATFGFFAYNPTDSAIRTYASDWGEGANFWDAQLAPNAWTFVEIKVDNMHAGKTAADGYLASQADGIIFTNVMGLKKPVPYEYFEDYQDWIHWSSTKVSDPTFGTVYKVDRSSSSILCTVLHTVEGVTNIYESVYAYVYNPTEEEVSCYPADKNYSKCSTVTYALAPKTWTKITIDKMDQFMLGNQSFIYVGSSTDELPQEGWLITAMFCGPEIA